MTRGRGWNITQTVAIGIYNPRTFARIPVPKDLTPEQLADLEKAIDEYNARLEVEHGYDKKPT